MQQEGERQGAGEFIELLEPLFGVSPTTVFTIKIKTREIANCKWDISPDFGYAYMENFKAFSGIVGGTEHVIENFNLISEGDESVHKIYISCNDDSVRKTFDISVDKTKPVVQEAYFSPQLIGDAGRLAKLIVITNEPTICKYGTAQGNAQLQDMEDGFTMRHEKAIVLPDQAAEHKYKVICEDRVKLVSEAKEAAVTYNPNLEFAIVSTYTKQFFNNTEAPFFSLQTNKKAGCLFKLSNEQAYRILSSTDGGYSHRKLFPRPGEAGSFAPGAYRFNIRCRPVDGKGGDKEAQIAFTIDSTPPSMMYVNDTSNIKLYPEYTCSKDRLRVKWLASDADSGIQEYEYSIAKSEGSEAIKNWTKDDLTRADYGEKWQYVRELALEEGSTYYFKVRAYNLVLQRSADLSSDGITIDKTKCDDLDNCVPGTLGCPDNVCTLIGECGVGVTCTDDSECRSKYCNNISKTCALPSCSDRVKNDEESDVDCGGTCTKCALNKACISQDDCESGYCAYKVCKEVDKCANGIRDALETGKDCGGPCRPCNTGKTCGRDIDCGEGLECKEGACVEITASPESTDKDGDGMPDQWEIQYGLDPNDPSDAALDTDKDGLTNLEEYKVKNVYGKSTNPNSADTDNDSFADKIEMDGETSPVDPEDFPRSSIFKVIMFVLGILMLISGFGYLAYRVVSSREEERELTRPMQIPRPMPPMQPRPITLKSKENMARIMERLKKKEEQKNIERKKLFETFGKAESKPKEETKEARKEAKPAAEEAKIIELPAKTKAKPKKPKSHEDVFLKLKQITESKKKKHK